MTIAALCCTVSPVAAADSPAMMGPLGLITVPSARMDESGTVRAQVAVSEPYVHAGLGVQIAEPLFINIRQSAQASSLRADPDRLYPGIDLKLRLMKEGPYRPALAIGWQSAVGHRRMAGEYISLSKRYKNFDFTGGMAWGRLGSAAHMSNPLKIFGSHFGKQRPLDGEEPNGPEDWFTGEDVGFFAGVEYDAPWVEGLRLKAEWGADDYVAEQIAFGHDAPEPWAVGFSYAPFPALDVGAAVIGGDRVMARLSVQTGVQNWPGRRSKADKPPPLRPYRTGIVSAGDIEQAAVRHDVALADTRVTPQMIHTRLEMNPHKPLPQQIGRAGRVLGNHGGQYAEAFAVTPALYGLRGPSVRLIRRDLEQAFTQNNGSPQEIWRNARFDAAEDKRALAHYKIRPADARDRLRIIGDIQTSLAEEDSGFLYRTGIIVETEQQLTRSLMVGGGIRFNIANNLERLNEYRMRPILPVREDVDVFANNPVTVDRAFMGWFKTLKDDVHVMLAGGYLEEMYGGVGGEVLYRPFGKTYALGAEAWQVFKRDPWSHMAQGFNGDHILTGHVNAWYEIPDTDLTLHARAGRFLAGDVGGSVALRHQFDHGGHVEAFATATDYADLDPYGGITHLYSGLRFTMPIGNVPVLPAGSALRMQAAQFGRGSGQALDKPKSLYEMTEPFSMRRLARDWRSVEE